MANKPLGITLPIRLGSNGYFENTTDVLTQIRSNLTNLLLTAKGERLLQPGFGSDLHKVIFEAMTDDGLSEVQAIIETAAEQWMPFIQIGTVDVLRDENAHTITVLIPFNLVTNVGLVDSITLVF